MENLFGEEYTDIPKPRKVDTANLNDAIEGLQKRVPKRPHGRCVDADKLMQEMRLFIQENMLSRDDARELLGTIKDAPTVLEAEEGK